MYEYEVNPNKNAGRNTGFVMQARHPSINVKTMSSQDHRGAEMNIAVMAKAAAIMMESEVLEKDCCRNIGDNDIANIVKTPGTKERD